MTIPFHKPDKKVKRDTILAGFLAERVLIKTPSHKMYCSGINVLITLITVAGQLRIVTLFPIIEKNRTKSMVIRSIFVLKINHFCL